VRHLNDADEVRAQYACEDNLRARQAIYDQYEGESPRDRAFDTIAELRPRLVLEVGGGQGELAQRLVDELDVELHFVDQSERMVELAIARGIDAQVGDVQDLPFADGTFDCAVAAWMLYHVPDLDRALDELARVLRFGGHLVAVTNGEDHLRELRDVFTLDFHSTFTRENAGAMLERRFRGVERRDVDGLVTLPSRDAVIAYGRSMIGGDDFDPGPFDVPLRSHTRVSIFVATK